MQHLKLFWRIGSLALVVFPGLLATSATGQTLKQIAKFDLPGPGGKRFDYLTIDEDDHYLISAHLARRQTYVIDSGHESSRRYHCRHTWRGRRGIRSGTQEVLHVERRRQHDWCRRPETDEGHQEAQDGAKPDGSTYAAPFHKLYVSDERGKAEAVVDVRTTRS